MVTYLPSGFQVEFLILTNNPFKKPELAVDFIPDERRSGNLGLRSFELQCVLRGSGA